MIKNADGENGKKKKKSLAYTLDTIATDVER